MGLTIVDEGEKGEAKGGVKVEPVAPTRGTSLGVGLADLTKSVDAEVVVVVVVAVMDEGRIAEDAATEEVDGPNSLDIEAPMAFAVTMLGALRQHSKNRAAF